MPLDNVSQPHFDKIETEETLKDFKDELGSFDQELHEKVASLKPQEIAKAFENHYIEKSWSELERDHSWVTLVQAGLSYLGYKDTLGNIDGLYGGNSGKTHEAVRKFQQDIKDELPEGQKKDNFVVDGRAGSQTMEKMMEQLNNISSEELGEEESESFFKGSELPQKVIDRLTEEYKDASEEDKEAALEQVEAISLIKKSKEKWNTVEIADRTFSFLRPEPNGEDVFAGKEGSGYEHVRYIKGDAMEDYLGNQQMFADGDAFEAFVEEHIPGTTRTIRLQNFADLMGVELSGYRRPDGTFSHVGDRGDACVSRSDGDEAYELNIKSDYADVFKNHLGFAQPVLTFNNSLNSSSHEATVELSAGLTLENILKDGKKLKEYRPDKKFEIADEEFGLGEAIYHLHQGEYPGEHRGQKISIKISEEKIVTYMEDVYKSDSIPPSIYAYSLYEAMDGRGTRDELVDLSMKTAEEKDILDKVYTSFGKQEDYNLISWLDGDVGSEKFSEYAQMLAKHDDIKSEIRDYVTNEDSWASMSNLTNRSLQTDNDFKKAIGVKSTIKREGENVVTKWVVDDDVS